MDACRTTFKFSCGLIVFCASTKFQQIVVGIYNIEVECVYVLIERTGRCDVWGGKGYEMGMLWKGDIKLIGVTFF